MQERLRGDLNESLIFATPPTVPAAYTVLASLVAFTAQGWVGAKIAMGFLALVATASVVYLFLRERFLAQPREDAHAEQWHGIFVACGFLHGLIWVWAAFALFPWGREVGFAQYLQPLAAVICCACLACLTPASPAFVAAFAAPAICAAAVVSGMQQSMTGYVIAACLLFGLCGMLMAHGKAHVALVRELETRRKNESLAEDLRHARNQIRELHHRAESLSRSKAELLDKIADGLRSPAMQRGELLEALAQLRMAEEAERLTAPTLFDVRRLFEGVAMVTRCRTRPRGIAFVADIAPDVPRLLHGDVIRLRRILLLLLDNALRFTEIGMVSLSVTLAQQRGESVQLRFAVQDASVGVAATESSALLADIPGNDNKAAPLALARRLVEVCGGRLEALGDVGQGVSFSFALSFMMGDSATDSLRGRPWRGMEDVYGSEWFQPALVEWITASCAPADRQMMSRMIADDVTDMVAVLLRLYREGNYESASDLACFLQGVAGESGLKSLSVAGEALDMAIARADRGEATRLILALPSVLDKSLQALNDYFSVSSDGSVFAAGDSVPRKPVATT